LKEQLMTNIVPLIHFPTMQQRQDISQATKAGTVNAEKARAAAS
jgi:hypothetical protein